MVPTPAAPLPVDDGLVAVVKRECPTCELVAPVLAGLGAAVTVYSQDDPAFPEGCAARDDRDLEVSFALDIATVPTLLVVREGVIVERCEGWDRAHWATVTGVADLGADLPEWKPGCGSLTHDPGVVDARLIAATAPRLRSRRVDLGVGEDEAEAMFARGWSDGLPVVAPTVERVARMLAGTTRDPGEVVTIVPPDLVECTVEKVAVNAVLAGCRPEYLPVVLAAVEAA